jgi:Zn-dependent membrane protease YugP
MFFDPIYLLFVFAPAILISMIVTGFVKSSYAKWRKVANSSGMSGAQAALELLRRSGITSVKIEQSKGFLSDHYDPRSATLRLSPDVYNGRSVASVGVALHEAGHALQHAQNYAPLTVRSMLVPVASIGSGYLPMVLIIAGFMLHQMGLAYVGLAIFAVAFFFTIVTLPVEFNASTRAKLAAVELGVVAPGREAQGVANVLNAAALTYVAAAVTALLNLLYWAYLIFGSRR